MNNINAILNLIAAGDSMLDAAETCGHDDCIKDWKKSRRLLMKEYNLNDSDICNAAKIAHEKEKMQKATKAKREGDKSYAKIIDENRDYLSELFPNMKKVNESIDIDD